MRVLLILLLVSCGKINHKISGDVTASGIPKEIKVEPDFEKAAEFCDQRYGYKTEKAESCFEDYRDYFKIEIGFDFKSIQSFCEDTYSTKTEINTCVKNFSDYIRTFNKK